MLDNNSLLLVENYLYLRERFLLLMRIIANYKRITRVNLMKKFLNDKRTLRNINYIHMVVRPLLRFGMLFINCILQVSLHDFTLV